jgi:hypothetical protein
MKEVIGHVVEQFGIKAEKKGFFKQWQSLTSSIKEAEDLPLHEAAEMAYKQLKTQGSE